MNSAIELSLNWLEKQRPQSMKELSRIVWARGIWNLPSKHTPSLIALKGDNQWDSNVRDVARIISALVNVGLIFPDVGQWLISNKEQFFHNHDIYDLTYYLIGLADMKIYDPQCAAFLVNNYNERWAYLGTTALIITALIKQENINYTDFIQHKGHWLLSHKRKNGGFNTISTTNIAIQALLLSGFKKQVQNSVDWLIQQQNIDGSWGEGKNKIVATALSLITLAYYDDTNINTRK